MKKNNQGFMLVEALVMSMVIIGVLIYMFIQFQIISRNYDKSFSYNSVTNLYFTNEIKNYLKINDTLTEIKNDIDNAQKKYVIVYQNNSWNISDYNTSIGNNLISKANIKTIVVANESLSEFKTERTVGFSEKMNDFIHYVKVDKQEEFYRIIIEFNDDTYASLKIGGK